MPTYDVAVFAGQKPAGDVLLAQDFVIDGGAVVTGIAKLAQRFLLTFLTIKGSVKYQPDVGCRFLQYAREGRILSDVDAFSLFSFSMGDVEQQLLAEQSPDDPPDERYADANLLNVTFAPGHLVLQIQLDSAAGETRTISLPVGNIF